MNKADLRTRQICIVDEKEKPWNYITIRKSRIGL